MKPSCLLNGILISLIVAMFTTSVWSADEWVYTVRPGDTLKLIAQQHLDNPNAWKQLLKLNKVSDPNFLRPGSKLRIPFSLSTTNNNFAEVVWVQGNAFQADGKTLLSNGTKLRVGDTVVTGSKSSVTVKFADQSRLLIMSDSKIILTHMLCSKTTGKTETQVTLVSGSIESVVTKKQKIDAKYEIKTPTLNLAVRGTRFKVFVDSKTGITRSIVTEGAVEASAKGKTVSLKAGQGTSASRDAAPSAPRDLLASPELKSPARQETVPAVFSWPQLSGAFQYRISILDRSGLNIVDELTTVDTKVRWTDLPDGDYQIKISGIDDAGFEGNFAVQDFTLNAKPEPPALRYPLDGAVVSGEKIPFRWARMSDVRHFQIQISDTADFKNIVAQVKQLPGRSHGIDLPLADGSYFWRVGAVVADNRQGPVSPAQFFAVRKGKIESESPDAVSKVLLKWKQGAPGQKIQVQASLDPMFHSTLLDSVQENYSVSFGTKGRGPYYVRIRRIESDGLSGTFEAPQQFLLPGVK